MTDYERRAAALLNRLATSMVTVGSAGPCCPICQFLTPLYWNTTFDFLVVTPQHAPDCELYLLATEGQAFLRIKPPARRKAGTDG